MRSEWESGFAAGWAAAQDELAISNTREYLASVRTKAPDYQAKKKTRRKSGWQRYMAQKKNQIRYKSGSRKGMLNLKAMGVQYRKKKR